MSVYLWIAGLVVAFAVVGGLLVRRAMRVRPAPRETHEFPERFADALEDMRLHGVATPEDLSVQTLAARETVASPPDLPGLPQAPDEMRRRSRQEEARVEKHQRGARDRGPGTRKP